MSQAPHFTTDISAAAFKANSYTVYAQLRAEAPVCRVTLPQKREAYLLTRYSDVSAMLKDLRFVKNPANALTAAALKKLRKPPKLFAPLRRNMLALDDPDHARLKRLVQAGFTPRRVEGLAARTAAISAALLDKVSAYDHFDLIQDYATPLPVTVISELLGVPHRDQARFARWSGALIRTAASRGAIVLALPQIIGFMRYLHQLVALKRAEPQEDLVSALVQLESEGDRLSGDELLSMIAILLSAGHETTQNLIGNGMLTLMQHPSAAKHLREKPEVIPSAVEELLRFAGPVETTTERYSREDVNVAGFEIPRGALVFGVLASANRDEAQFPQADKFQVERQPNRHLTFGEGSHYCVGAALARMEGVVAFANLLQRFPRLRLAQSADKLLWNPGMVLRSLRRLPVLI